MCPLSALPSNQVAILLNDSTTEAVGSIKAYRDSLSRGARAIVGGGNSAQTRLAVCAILSYPCTLHARLLHSRVPSPNLTQP